jgi:hypothetical protein
MQKDVIRDLKILAQDILQLEEVSELGLLRQKSQEINEKLTILEYLKSIDLQESQSKTKSEVVAKTNMTIEEKTVLGSAKNEMVEELNEDLKVEIVEEISIGSFELSEPVEREGEILEIEASDEEVDSLEDFFVPTFQSVKEDFSLKEEFKHTVSLDDTENLFVTKKTESKQLSLNDKLLNSSIQVGLNDRIAFVNQLFNFSQSEFNKALSVLNSFKTEGEAKNYINITLKQQYGWKNKEEILERFLFLVERKFL